MSTLVCLDRNVLTYMDRHNQSKQNHIAGSEVINELLGFDQKGNFITILSALLEGGMSKSFTQDNKLTYTRKPRREIKCSIQKDLAIVSLFCNKNMKDAKLFDGLFLNGNINALANVIYSADNDHYLSDKIKLLDEIREVLIDKVPFKNRKAIYKKIKLIVLTRYSHLKPQPFIITSLICLFGGERARKLFKFGQANYWSYNAISDFNQIRFLSELQRHPFLTKKIKTVEFLSADSDIQFIMELFQVTGMIQSEYSSSSILLKHDFKLNYKLILDELSINPNQKNENISIFTECFKDFYGYDISAQFDFVKNS